VHKLIGVALGLLLAGCGTQDVSVRQHFVPTSDRAVANWAQLGPLDEAAWQDGRIPVPTGADWTPLGPGPGNEPGVLFLMAHAGIGDRIPVQDKGGRTHFVIIVAEGEDQYLLLVVHSKEGAQGFDVIRDNPMPVEVGGGRYELLYPTTRVGAAPDAMPTTDKPTIIVRHWL